MSRLKKRTKGQQRTLDLLSSLFGIRIDDYTDEELKAFFAYTDRGVTPVAPSDRLVNLLGWFRHLAFYPTNWGEDFSKGRIFPQDFYEEPEPWFQLACTIHSNRKVMGVKQDYKITLWGLMETGRRWGIPLREIWSFQPLAKSLEEVIGEWEDLYITLRALRLRSLGPSA